MGNESETENKRKRGTGVVLVLVGAGLVTGIMTVSYWNLVLKRKAGEADGSSVLPMVSDSGRGKPASPVTTAIPEDVTSLQERFTQAAESHKVNQALLDAGKELVKRYSQSPDAHALLAQMLLYDGQFEAAKRELEQSLKLAPTQPASLVLLGTVFMKQGKPADAVPMYAKAVEQAPGQASYMLHLAQAHLTLGEKEKSRAICQDVLDRVDSGSGDALALMADVYAADGDYVHALANVQRAIESTPISRRKQQVLFIRKKASLLRRSGEPAQAVMTLQNLTAQEVSEPDVLEELAKAWSASGDKKQATTIFEKALRMNPTDWELAAGACRWNLIVHDLFKARIYADLAQRLNPRSDEVADLQSAVLAAERASTTQPK